MIPCIMLLDIGFDLHALATYMHLRTVLGQNENR